MRFPLSGVPPGSARDRGVGASAASAKPWGKADLPGCERQRAKGTLEEVGAQPSFGPNAAGGSAPSTSPATAARLGHPRGFGGGARRAGRPRCGPGAGPGWPRQAAVATWRRAPRTAPLRGGCRRPLGSPAEGPGPGRPSRTAKASRRGRGAGEADTGGSRWATGPAAPPRLASPRLASPRGVARAARAGARPGGTERGQGPKSPRARPHRRPPRRGLQPPQSPAPRRPLLCACAPSPAHTSRASELRGFRFRRASLWSLRLAAEPCASAILSVCGRRAGGERAAAAGTGGHRRLRRPSGGHAVEAGGGGDGGEAPPCLPRPPYPPPPRCGHGVG